MKNIYRQIGGDLVMFGDGQKLSGFPATIIKQYNRIIQMDKAEKRDRALGLFVESVLKPDHELRQCAHNQKCYNELLEWRQEVLDYLNSRRKEEFGQ